MNVDLMMYCHHNLASLKIEMVRLNHALRSAKNVLDRAMINVFPQIKLILLLHVQMEKTS